MKKTNQIVLTFLLLISSSIFGQDLQTDSTMNSIFTSAEINNLEKILIFFSNQICKLEDLDNHHAIDCFESYCKNLKERTNAFGSVDLMLSLKEQKVFYNNIDSFTFNEIWHFEKAWKPKTTDTIIEIDINPNGKYAKFLKSLGQEYDKVGKYYQDLESLGGICPTMIAELLMNYQEFNFRDERIRLLFAIHYLTMNDQFSEKSEN
jgi:hypothetical protein